MSEPEAGRIALLVRLSLALLFLCHGLVPKLLWLSADEVRMITAHGWTEVERVAQLAGVLELGWAGVLCVVRWQRWPLLLTAGLLVGLLLDVAWFAPELLIQAFNPLSTNLLGLSLCLIGWLVEAPRAGQTVPH
ncbi:DoxX family protein [Pseudomonas cavernae]|uniref:DoxX family protein n=1 Tax=Pseudomonas cavernae TaxID=2320867 RepID=A0A385Z491_9PSED|nr:DoxX-like family protein [Pseudomonas cavernae]AYC33350.1 DoxX family protein [Pseudomonas cavernae]